MAARTRSGDVGRSSNQRVLIENAQLVMITRQLFQALHVATVDAVNESQRSSNGGKRLGLR